MPAPDPADERPDSPPAESSADAPAGPSLEPAAREIVLPRGCNPLTFGVVMATLEMAVILWLWSRCS
jgi:hypothetical protein